MARASSVRYRTYKARRSAYGCRTMNEQRGRSQSALARAKEGALENAILTSASFSIIATDEKGVVQLFNVGAERMLGYRADEVVDQLSPSDLHDPEEVRERAEALSLELGIAIAPGFEALA